MACGPEELEGDWDDSWVEAHALPPAACPSGVLGEPGPAPDALHDPNDVTCRTGDLCAESRALSS